MGITMHALCALIPSYNEAATIGGIVRRLGKRGLDVYVVDDGSDDDTAGIAGKEGAVVIRNTRNLGKGASLREGFKRVLEGDYRMVLVMDGDDQHDINDIARLIKRIRETDAGMVIGNRMHDTSSMPLIRIAVNRFMSYVISVASGQKVPDTQCGFRLIRRDLLEAVTLESSKYEIESELIIKSAKKGFKIESAPIKTVYNNEKSGINPIIDTFRFIAFMAKIVFKR
ncbi:MAG: glycosyltransferase family 2 protein [Candidatus Omnitrophota bacterium]